MNEVTNITEFPKPDYFGGCPICRRNDGYLNIGRDHWFICHRHRVRWCIGSNLFSSWRDQTEGDFQRNADRIGPYREVEPYTWSAQELGLHEATESEEICPDYTPRFESTERVREIWRCNICGHEFELGVDATGRTIFKPCPKCPGKVVS